jgi:hypothetical protein
MATPALAPQRTFAGVVAVWIAAAVVSLAIGIIAPPEWRSAWMPLGMALCLVLAFGIQLRTGRSQGFIERVAASSLGALLVMGLVGVGFGLATLFAG